MAGPPNKGKGAGIAFLRAHLDYQGDDCVIWPLLRVRGYGILYLDGESYKASRFMCELVNGPPPTPDHEAAHSCGNGVGGCVNGRHLSWKTPTENQADRWSHGTFRRRTTPGKRYKLTFQQVEEIRALSPAMTHDELAAKFDCTRENIGRIIRRQNWKREPQRHIDRRAGMTR